MLEIFIRRLLKLSFKKFLPVLAHLRDASSYGKIRWDVLLYLFHISASVGENPFVWFYFRIIQSYCGSVYVIIRTYKFQKLESFTFPFGNLLTCPLQLFNMQSSYGFVDYFDRRSAALAIVSLNGRHL